MNARTSRRRQYRSLGLCACGVAPRPGAKTCVECYESHRDARIAGRLRQRTRCACGGWTKGQGARMCRRCASRMNARKK